MSIRLNHSPPFTPSSRAVSIRSVQTVGSTQPQRAQDLSGTFSRFRHCHRLCVPSAWSSRLHLPAPLRSPGITRLHRYYGCSDSWTAGSSALQGRMNTVFGRPGLPVSRHRPSDHSVSNHLPSSRQVSGVFSARLTGPPRRGHPFRGHASWASPFPSRLATTAGRIEFLALRTDRSPPVALHLASRRRSYFRLQGARHSWQGLSPC